MSFTEVQDRLAKLQMVFFPPSVLFLLHWCVCFFHCRLSCPWALSDRSCPETDCLGFSSISDCIHNSTLFLLFSDYAICSMVAAPVWQPCLLVVALIWQPCLSRGQTTVNKKAPIHYIISIKDKVYRPLWKCLKKSPKNSMIRLSSLIYCGWI